MTTFIRDTTLASLSYCTSVAFFSGLGMRNTVFEIPVAYELNRRITGDEANPIISMTTIIGSGALRYAFENMWHMSTAQSFAMTFIAVVALSCVAEYAPRIWNYQPR